MSHFRENISSVIFQLFPRRSWLEKFARILKKFPQWQFMQDKEGKGSGILFKLRLIYKFFPEKSYFQISKKA